MPSCFTCTQSVNQKSPGLQCNGRCNQFYHAKCVNLTKSDLGSLLLPGSLWMCPQCRPTIDPDSSNIFDGQQSSRSDTDATTAMLIDIKKQLEALAANYTDIKQTIDNISTKFDVLDQIQAENIQLKTAVVDLSHRIDSLEQYYNNRN
ncbi:hypothetical protein MML48_9g00003293 [Holotrichia oblita]|uniref:Uncharacterized protein n=1 Tax=Holotrichia oblita TaxID=644536 RepID=A0ACB9SJL7_HOLOL|nr:hypothetical protein MML48_9g00003293 [Holotrichia oblita]